MGLCVCVCDCCSKALMSFFVVKGIVVFVCVFFPPEHHQPSGWDLPAPSGHSSGEHDANTDNTTPRYICPPKMCQTFKSNSCHLLCWDMLRGCWCYILKGDSSSPCGWDWNRRTVREMCQICRCSVLGWHLKLCFSCNWKHVLVWQYHHQYW